MKLKTKIILSGCALFAAAFLFTSCTSPSSYLFTAHTNDIPRITAKTNLVSITNYTDKVVATTNTSIAPNGSVITTIQLLPVHESQVSSVSEIRYSTNYDVSYTVSTNAVGIANIAGTAANIVAPGSGNLVTAGLVGILGLFASWFTRRQTKAKGDLIAGTLVQSIETLREVLKSNPSTAPLDDKIVNFLHSNQASFGVVQEVATLVENTVDNTDAKAAARAILDITKP